MYPEKLLTHKIKQNKIRHIVVINVNAQNEVSSDLDKSAAVPGFRDVVSAIVNIPTSFYLPPEDVDNLRTAATELMKQSLDYRNLLAEFAAHPNPDTIFAAPPLDAQEFKPLNEKEKQ